MYIPKIKKYQKKFEYSYAFGAYPVIDLLKNHPEKVYEVILKEKNEKSDGIEEVLELCKKNMIRIEISSKLIDKIAVKENTYVVGVFKKYECEIENSNNHILLVNPSNMGNLGTIIRTMLGFGFRDLGIIRPCVDIFDPMVIRSTMGAIFNIRFELFDSIEEYINKYGKHNIYSFMLNGSKDIRDVEFKKPFTIVQGNEGSGLDDSYLKLGESVYIPHGKDIDSLNLSIATSISLWEVYRKGN